MPHARAVVAPKAGAAPPGSSRPILPAGVSAPPLRISRSGYCASKAAGSETAQVGNCALAEVTVVIDTSAATIRFLNVVIVVLRIVVLYGELAPAITAALLRMYLRKLVE